MALIKCPECGHEVSTFAKACPNCGYPLDNVNVNSNKQDPIANDEQQCNDSISNGLSFKSNGDGTCEVAGLGSCKDSEIVIPAFNDQDEAVVAIGQKAFAYHNNIINIKIPSSVNKIDNLAFTECTSLSNVNIPNNVTYIGNGAFSHTAVSNINVPNSVVFIGNGAFISTKLKNIELPGSLKQIGSNAFSNCNSLISAIIGEGIETLPFSLFSECHNLKTVTLPQSLKTLWGAVFRECSSLENIELPEGLLKIYNDFNKCSSLSKLFIPDGVNIIGDGCFDGCVNLSYLSIGPNLKEFGFFESKLKRLDHIEFRGTIEQWNAIEIKYTYPNTIVCTDGRIESMLELYTRQKKSNGLTFNESGITECECTGVGTCKDKKIIIPSISPKGLKVTGIIMLAFNNCLSIENAVLNEGIERIGHSAFENCKNLRCITIPRSVYRISKDAFLGCNSLKTINYKGTKSEWDKIKIECTIDATIVYSEN